ncbi:MAG: hypothetical protein OEX76_00910 [Candidatus Bathyarchaeota archaeon]|nr:hypothetical protein [Candidatus Bathyarchaeota archaeon]MDH5532383.1 hypothetical protein [Candidatus Bathyarchaeota archaeon]MDH5712524.1 hypothetical protein [Candidatus Bathyarchaeota archaeon]
MRAEGKMPIPPALVTRFFQLITSRQFAEAERELERLSKDVKKNEFNSGFLRALNGMILAHRSNDDRYVFVSKMKLNNKQELTKYRREFSRHEKNKLHSNYDRGFFRAWAEYTRVLVKLEEDRKPKKIVQAKLG